MHELGKDIIERGEHHDWTKIVGAEEFYKDFSNTINNGKDFVKGKWYQNHIKEERHHLLSRCPEDVNLIDVIEMISDCVCAGMARSGEIRDLEIPDEVLRKAVKNTADMIKNNIEVVD